MSNTYSIKLVNKSRATQKYGFFGETPKISDQVQGSVWSNIWKTESLSETGQSALVKIYTQWYAFNGRSSGSLADGVEINVSEFDKVTLGEEEKPGTTLPYVVIDDVPRFDKPREPTGKRNAYEIRTGKFQQDQAREGNWVIGLGSANDESGEQTPLATFMPNPQKSYQIQPANTYYIAVGSFKKGRVVDVKEIGRTIAIDFTKYESPVEVEHTSTGDLVIVSKEK